MGAWKEVMRNGVKYYASGPHAGKVVGSIRKKVAETNSLQAVKQPALGVGFRITGTVDPKVETYLTVLYNEALGKIKLKHAERADVIAAVEKVTVELSNRMATCAGRVWWRKGLIRLNYRLLANNETELRDTFLHELAHLVANVIFSTNCGHDWRWKIVASHLGARPNRCHTMDVDHLRKPQMRYLYGCGCDGREFALSSRKHFKAKVMEQLSGRCPYYCPKCKKTLTYKEGPIMWSGSKQEAACRSLKR